MIGAMLIWISRFKTVTLFHLHLRRVNGGDEEACLTIFYQNRPGPILTCDLGGMQEPVKSDVTVGSDVIKD